MPTDKKITILTPTTMEAEAVADIAGGFDAAVVVSGVGMAETAATLAGLQREGRLDGLVILAGIAGALPGSGFIPGDSAVAVSESIADLGAVREGAFVALYPKLYTCPLAETVTSVPRARFGTVNRVNGAANGKSEYELENMEGAAFFAVCSAFGIPFIELRSVSNLTTDSRAQWRVTFALKSLAGALRNILTEIK